MRLCFLMSLSPCVHACISCGGLNAPTTVWLKSFGMASCRSSSDVHFVSGVHASVVTVHNLPSVSAACSTVLYKRVYRVVDSWWNFVSHHFCVTSIFLLPCGKKRGLRGHLGVSSLNNTQPVSFHLWSFCEPSNINEVLPHEVTSPVHRGLCCLKKNSVMARTLCCTSRFYIGYL